MTKGNIGKEFRSNELDEKRNYYNEKIKQNELMSKKHQKVYKNLNYAEHLLIIASTVTGCVSNSAFISLDGIHVGIGSSAATIKSKKELNAGIKMYKSIIEKKKINKHDKIVLLNITKLSTIEVLISKALIDSNISHYEFASLDNVLKEYDKMKEGIQNS